MNRTLRNFLLFFSIALIAACGGGGGSSTPEVAPTPAPTPAPATLDLDAAFDFSMSDGTYTQGVIVYEKGEILRSDFRGITQNEIDNLPTTIQALGSYFVVRDETNFVTSQSVGKSVTSILIGIAIDDGYIQNLDQSASDFISEWQNDDRANITIRKLLNMRSGLESFGGSSILDLISLEDATTTCIDRQLRGEDSFSYLNCDTQVLGEIIERATGQDLKEFADDNLFSILGIDAFWWKDPTGNYISYAGVDMTMSEYLVFGQLFLDENQSIISTEYLDQIYTGYGSEDGSDIYSLGFWYFNDHFQMRGLDGQMVAINFDEKIILLRNSLYLAPFTERIVDMDAVPFSVAPITLPEAVGGNGLWDFSTFIDLLYVEDSDTTGPLITELDIISENVTDNTLVFDSGDTQKTIRLRWRLQDESGVTFVSPFGNSRILLARTDGGSGGTKSWDLDSSQSERVSGDSTDGYYEKDIELIAAEHPSGDFSISLRQIADLEGNITTMEIEQGHPLTIINNSN